MYQEKMLGSDAVKRKVDRLSLYRGFDSFLERILTMDSSFALHVFLEQELENPDSEVLWTAIDNPQMAQATALMILDKLRVIEDIFWHHSSQPEKKQVVEGFFQLGLQLYQSIDQGKYPSGQLSYPIVMDSQRRLYLEKIWPQAPSFLYTGISFQPELKEFPQDMLFWEQLTEDELDVVLDALLLEEEITKEEILSTLPQWKNAELLHCFLEHYNWDNGLEVPVAALTNPVIEAATALLLLDNAQGISYLLQWHQEQENFLLEDYSEEEQQLITIVLEIYTGLKDKKYPHNTLTYPLKRTPASMRFWNKVWPDAPTFLRDGIITRGGCQQEEIS